MIRVAEYELRPNLVQLSRREVLDNGICSNGDEAGCINNAYRDSATAPELSSTIACVDPAYARP